MITRVCRLYGKGDIRIDTLPVDEPGANEVLVAVGAGGICGSDLHYFQDGGFGPVRVREPIILGHEGAGTIVAMGEHASSLADGDRVALNPSRPCHDCEYCSEELYQHCLNMRFMGSAMRFPHEQGLFRDHIIMQSNQCHKIGSGVSLAQAACTEPLAVCLHACRMAGALAGKRVLITGAGPIGLLCTALAVDAGAAEIIVSDLQDMPLEIAKTMGATGVINVARDAEGMEKYAADKGYFHTVFECSGAAPAIHSAISVLRPRGKLVQVGVTGDTPLPINLVVGKEIQIQGTHRFHQEFGEALDMIESGRINPDPILSATYPLDDAAEAFAIAGDRSRAIKIHLSFQDV